MKHVFDEVENFRGHKLGNARNEHIIHHHFEIQNIVYLTWQQFQLGYYLLKKVHMFRI